MILVDCNPEPGSQFPFMMVASGGFDELAAFGLRLGLKSEWIRNDFGIAHFRINAKKRAEAIEKGAREASMREIMAAAEGRAA